MMTDFQFRNLIKAIERRMKQSYCAMYFDNLIRKFRSEIIENKLRIAVRVMYGSGQLAIYGYLLKLVVR